MLIAARFPHLGFVLLTALCTSVTAPAAEKSAGPPPCTSLESCLAAARAIPACSPGCISAEQGALAQALRGYGRAAVPGLVVLLREGGPGARDVAAYTLRDLG